MGLFSKKKLITASQTLTLIEDTPDLIEQVVVNSVIQQTPSLSTDILNSIINCLGSKGGQYYRYGRDKFTNGLPEGTMGFESVDLGNIQIALDKEFPPVNGGSNEVIISILSNELPIVADYLCANWLRTNTDWDDSTNEFTYNIAGNDYICRFTDGDIINDKVHLRYSYYDGTTNTGEIVFTVSFPLSEDELYYLTVYKPLDDKGDPINPSKDYWVYWEGSKKYPILNLPDREKAFTQFTPIVPLRINNRSYTDPKLSDTDLYKTSKQLLRRLDIKIEEFDESINANPDIEDIDHAYFVLGADINSDKESTINYLYYFFTDLMARSNFTINDLNYWKTTNTVNPSIAPPVNYVDIKDGTYHARLAYYAIESKTVSGSIGKPGSVTKQLKYGFPDIVSSEESLGWRAFNPENRLIIRKQEDDTSFTELTIYGVQHANLIYGANRYYMTDLGDTQEGEFKPILVPLNISIIENNLTLLQRNELYYDCMKIVFNAFEWKKLKWYQTGFFKFFTMVITIAISIYTGGLGGAIVGAIGAGVTGLTLVLVNVLTHIVVATAFQILAENVGIEWAMAIAVVAMVAGGVGFDSISQLPSTFVNLLQTISANAVSAFTGISNAVGGAIEDIIAESERAYAEYQSSMEMITEKQELLDINHQLDPYSIFKDVGMLPTESFNTYLQRSLYLGWNEATIKAVDSFYDTHLNLRLGA